MDMNEQDGGIWQGRYKIPWDDPGFSRRMLAEHLSQEHDLASRRSKWIDNQVDWIHGDLLSELQSRILDLGCGPGLYCHRLASLGHSCLGIDFGPASIEYAQKHIPADTDCQFSLGDMRTQTYSGQHDLVMILFGELNAFAPDEVRELLPRISALLSDNGPFIIEIQTNEAVERVWQKQSITHAS